MNAPKVDEQDYIHFLIATQGRVTATEAARSHPAEENGPAHDAYTRLLYRVQSDGDALCEEVQSLVDRKTGILVLDDSTLDKPYAQAMELVTYHWSGKHRAAVKGINLISLLWTDGAARLPCDLRIYGSASNSILLNIFLPVTMAFNSAFSIPVPFPSDSMTRTASPLPSA